MNSQRTIRGHSALLFRVGCSATAVLFLTCYLAFAQPPAAPRRTAPPANSLPTPLEPVTNRGQRSPEELKAFVKDVSSNDARLDVFVGQGRLLTLKQDLVDPNKQSPLIAMGDPTVIDFEVVGQRQLRITGRRIGVTDLSIVTQDNENYSVEVHVNANLEFLDVRLKQIFPSATLQLSQIRDHVVVGGQARDARQVTQIIETITAYLISVQTGQAGKISSKQSAKPDGAQPHLPRPATPGDSPDAPGRAEVLPGTDRPDIEGQIPAPVVINLIRVPGPSQVQLRVQVAELNRTAARELGTSLLFKNDDFAIGSEIGPGIPLGAPGKDATSLTGLLGLSNPLAATSTVFGIFDQGGATAFVNALRRNQVLKILAEPNLVAMNGEEATFLSGGEFPVPIPQPSSGGAAGLVTIQYKTFGVQLAFIPYILDDETIRLSVSPEVSSIDFSGGVTIQGTQVPGINTRRTSTVVEMQQGQTLAISGILQVTLEGTTSRVPGLGDLPYIGPLFSNNTTKTVEKELIVLVTPHLVDAMQPEQVSARPGDEVTDPADREFYLKGEIEGRACLPFRATTNWEDPLGIDCQREVECHFVNGPYGYTQ